MSLTRARAQTSAHALDRDNFGRQLPPCRIVASFRESVSVLRSGVWRNLTWLIPATVTVVAEIVSVPEGHPPDWQLVHFIPELQVSE